MYSDKTFKMHYPFLIRTNQPDIAALDFINIDIMNIQNTDSMQTQAIKRSMIFFTSVRTDSQDDTFSTEAESSDRASAIRAEKSEVNGNSVIKSIPAIPTAPVEALTSEILEASVRTPSLTAPPTTGMLPNAIFTPRAARLS